MFRVICLLMVLVSSCTVHAQSESVSISVFEDHDIYVQASVSYGLSWQLLALAAERENIQLDLQQTSWQAALQRLKNRRLDLVFGGIKTDQRQRWAAFSVPLYKEGSAIFTQLDNKTSKIDSIDLKNSVIGVSAGSVQERLADEMGFENIYATIDRPQLYKMLNNGRLDYLFFGKSIVQYYCYNYGIKASNQCVTQVGPDFLPNHLHVLALKDNASVVAILERLNERIRALATSEETKTLFVNAGLSAADWRNWGADL